MGAQKGTNATGTVEYWRARFPWLMLLDCTSLAMTPSILTLATAGAFLGSLVWWCCGAVWLSPEAVDANPALRADTACLAAWPGSRRGGMSPLGLDESPWGKSVEERLGRWPSDPVTTVPYRMLRPFYRLSQRHGSWSEVGYYSCGALGTVAVWSLLGLAISRIAVVHYGKGERLAFSTALRFSLERFTAQAAAFLMPVGGILVMALPLFLIGMLLRWSPLVVLVGIVWIFVLPVGFVMTVMLLGWVFGWPLMWGAISSEGGDAFDAVSRSCSYTFQQPMRYAFYTLVALLCGCFGWIVVWCVSELVIWLANWGIGVGAGTERMQQLNDAIQLLPTDSLMLSVGGRLFQFWQSFVRMGASSYAYGYFWCAAASIYLLLRYDTDSTEWDEIYTGRHGAAVFELAGVTDQQDDH